MKSLLFVNTLIALLLLSVWTESLAGIGDAAGIRDAASTGDEPLNKDSVQHRIARQVLMFPQEKLYVHTDRVTYVAGESIWFRAYLVDAVLHTPSVRNAYVYLELVSPTDSVVGRVLVGRNDGAFSGRLDLDPGLTGGDYVLRAYTDRESAAATMGNHGSPVFHKKIQLLGSAPSKPGTRDMTGTAPGDTYALSFFPEGGYLIEGVENRVAFKALYPDGSPAEVKGRLMDRQGRDYGPVETLHGGMGRFEFTPLKDRQYVLVGEPADGTAGTGADGAGREFALPEAETGAVALQTRLTAGELQVSVLRSPGTDTSTPLYLLLHTRGMVHYMEPWDDNYGGIAFETADFPSGVVQVLLLDANTNPLSERLVFCRSNDDARLDFSTDSDAYSPRSPVKASVKLTDGTGNPLSGAFSVAVTDDTDVAQDREQDILATILLGSELRGYIPDPAYYLKEENRQALDILMMTHGWRRYNIPEVIRQRYEQPAAIALPGLTIRGTVTTDGSRGRPIPDRKVSIFSWQTDYSDETVTDSLGRFAFGGLEFADSLTFVVQAETPKWRNHPRLTIEKEIFPPAPGTAAAFIPPRRPPGTGAANADGGALQSAGQTLAQQAYLIEKAVRHNSRYGLREIEIEEVQVDAKRDPLAGQSFSYYMPKEKRDVLTSEQLEELQPMNLSDALKYIPYLNLNQEMINNMVLIIDDIIINNVTNIDDIIDPFNIERVGIIKGRGAASVLLGRDGPRGAIVITTKKGLTPSRFQKYQRENIRVVNPLGLQEPVEFYSPTYETTEQRNRKEPDLRTTIYWNSDVKIPSNGHAGFDFYSADTRTTYTVVIEGVADNGLLIRKVARINRK